MRHLGWKRGMGAGTSPKGFSASKCDVGNWIFSKSWECFGNVLGIFLGNFLRILCEFIVWEFFRKSLRILWELFGNTLRILWEFFGNSLENLCGIL
jgi:hypothetical protein